MSTIQHSIPAPCFDYNYYTYLRCLHHTCFTHMWKYFPINTRMFEYNLRIHEQSRIKLFIQCVLQSIFHYTCSCMCVLQVRVCNVHFILIYLGLSKYRTQSTLQILQKKHFSVYYFYFQLQNSTYLHQLTKYLNIISFGTRFMPNLHLLTK